MNEKPKGPPPPRPPPRPAAAPPLAAKKPAPPPPPQEVDIPVDDLVSEPPPPQDPSRSRIPLTVLPTSQHMPVASPVIAPAAPPVPVASPATAPVAPRAAAAATEPENEARKYKRLPFEVSVAVASEHNFFAGLTLNISEGGLFVSTHEVHVVGTNLEISLSFPGDGEPTTLRTVVRWVRTHSASDGGQPGLGLSFLDLPADVSAKIQRFMKKRDPLFYED